MRSWVLIPIGRIPLFFSRWVRGRDGVADWEPPGVERRMPDIDAVISFWGFLVQYLHWQGKFLEGSCRSHITCGMNSLIDRKRVLGGPVVYVKRRSRTTRVKTYRSNISRVLGYLPDPCDGQKVDNRLARTWERSLAQLRICKWLSAYKGGVTGLNTLGSSSAIAAPLPAAILHLKAAAASRSTYCMKLTWPSPSIVRTTFDGQVRESPSLRVNSRYWMFSGKPTTLSDILLEDILTRCWTFSSLWLSKSLSDESMTSRLWGLCDLEVNRQK